MLFVCLFVCLFDCLLSVRPFGHSLSIVLVDSCSTAFSFFFTRFQLTGIDFLRSLVFCNLGRFCARRHPFSSQTKPRPTAGSDQSRHRLYCFSLSLSLSRLPCYVRLTYGDSQLQYGSIRLSIFRAIYFDAFAPTIESVETAEGVRSLSSARSLFDYP